MEVDSVIASPFPEEPGMDTDRVSRCPPAPHSNCPHGACLCFCECPCACKCIYRMSTRCHCVPIERRQIAQTPAAPLAAPDWGFSSCSAPLGPALMSAEPHGVPGSQEATAAHQRLAPEVTAPASLPVLLPQKRASAEQCSPSCWNEKDEAAGDVPPHKKRWPADANSAASGSVVQSAAVGDRSTPGLMAD